MDESRQNHFQTAKGKIKAMLLAVVTATPTTVFITMIEKSYLVSADPVAEMRREPADHDLIIPKKQL